MFNFIKTYKSFFDNNIIDADEIELNKTLNYFLISLVVFVALLPLSSLAQIKLTNNDGFEGNHHQGIPPYSWNNCNDGYSTGDTQPGSFGVTKGASEGNSYLSLVARKYSPPATVETVWADIKQPFEKNKCYNLLIDLSLSQEFFGTLNWNDYYFNNPCIFQIYGFNGDCFPATDSELLWQSSTLDIFAWTTFNVNIKPTLNTFNKIAINPYFIPFGNLENSAVMIDNLRFQTTENVLTNIDGVLVLPSSSTGIVWYYNDDLIQGEENDSLTLFENGFYQATYYDANGCFVVSERIYFKLNSETFNYYPNPSNGLFVLYFYSQKDTKFSFQIFDAIGRLVYSNEQLELKVGKNFIPIEMKYFEEGYYTGVWRKTNGDEKTIRLILVR